MFFTLSTFVFFTALVAYISWRMTRTSDLSTKKGYFLAGSTLNASVIAGSMMLTNLSTEQMVGLNGQAYMGGMDVMSWESAASTGIVILALFFLPKYLKGAITTIPEFLEIRYDKQVRDIVSVCFLFNLGIGFLPTVLYSGSLAMMKLFNVEQLFNVSFEVALVGCVIAIGIIGSIYAIFGGLRAVAISDTINGIGLLIGGMLIPFLGFKYIGDGDFFAGVSTVFTANPQKFNAIGGPDSRAPFGTVLTGQRIVSIYYWASNQLIIQRALAAKNLEEGQKGVLLTAFLKIVFGPIMLVIPGILAFHIFGGDLQGDTAYPTLVTTVLPMPLIGFFGAVLFGAVLSSYNSGLNSSSTIFALDIWRPWVNPTMSDADTVKVSKIFGTIMAIASITIAPLLLYYTGGVFEFIQKISGLFSVPIATIVLIGVFSKRVTGLSAKLAILFFVVVYGYTQFINPVKMHFLYVMAILFCISTTIMFVVSAIKPEGIYEEPVNNDVSLQPWSYRVTVSTALMSLLVWLFVIFSPVGILHPAGNIGMRVSVISILFIALTAFLCIFTRRYEKNQVIKS